MASAGNASAVTVPVAASAAAADPVEDDIVPASALLSPILHHTKVGRRASIASIMSIKSVLSGGGNDFGGKTIGFAGGLALLINNLTGSGMVLFPGLYQQSGWLPVTLALCLLAVLSTICGVMVVESMAMIPGNEKFEKRVEYTSLAKYYLSRRMYNFTQLFYQLSLVCNNMSMIIQSVQVMDFTIAAIFGRSCAIPEFYPNPGFHCPPAVSGDITPFGNGVYLFSIGFLATAALALPLGFFNLNDNVIVQKGAFLSVVAIVLTWIGLFASRGLEASRVPAWGSDVSPVLGITIFNFAIITSIPSWVNEKEENVSIMKTFGASMPIAVLLFSCIGIFGGLAFDPWFNAADNTDTILNKLYDTGNIVARVVVNLTSIPIFSIMCRYNLIENKVCGPKMANFLGVIAPWLLCIPLYTGTGFSNLANWAGTILNSVVNFIVPPLIYIVAIRRTQEAADAAGMPQFGAITPGNLQQPVKPAPGPAAAATAAAAPVAAASAPVTVKTVPVVSASTHARSGSGDANTSLAATFDSTLSRPLIDPSMVGTPAPSNGGGDSTSWSVVPPALWPYRIRISQGLVIFMSLLCLSVIIVNIIQAAGGNT